MRLLTLSVLVALSLPLAAMARDYGNGLSGDEYYRSTDGSLVHRPTHDEHPEFGRITADCRDGTIRTIIAGPALVMEGLLSGAPLCPTA
jgi:hypothetical protein